ncbi:AIPR family protein [Pelistega sp. NLN82]|uniref:AIPR family protein n=1 Tax=Pelistega ratti TaxID=2652177 RepID=A0A6L9Y793_9BURK|nr:AIPR family protein [Pelistega ratti]NEN75737.1 AIPR family protein [Pelistega ratti]
MTLDEYYTEIMNDISYAASANSEYKGDCFREKISEVLEDSGYFSDQPEWVSYKSNAGRIDGVYFDEQKAELLVIVLDFKDDENIQSLPQGEIETIVKSAKRFYERSLEKEFYQRMEESSSGYEAARYIYDRRDLIKSLKIILLSNRKLSDRVKSVSVEGIDRVEIWDIDRIYQYEQSRGKSESIKIDIQKLEIKIPLLLASQANGVDSYLGVIPAKFLVDIYSEYGSRLLETNVRSFLQFKGGVNKGIKNTVITEPVQFFSYNNGLTATADSIKRDEKGNLIFIENLQIVNGGQTTVSLYMTANDKKYDTNISKVYVPIKLMVLENTTEHNREALLANIARYANSQNKINDSDLQSNHEFHRYIQECSRRILAPGAIRDSGWYYERARGSYEHEKNTQKSMALKRSFEEKFPKKQKITKIDLAKLILIFNSQPQDAVKGAEIAYKMSFKFIDAAWKDENTKKNFNDCYFRDIIAQKLIYDACHEVVYSNNSFVGNTRAAITAYSVALMCELLKRKGLRFDFDQIWREQKITVTIKKEFANLSEAVNRCITDSANRKNKAILSYSKSKEAFEDILNIADSVVLGDNILREMKPLFEERVEVAKRESKFINNTKDILVQFTRSSVANWREVILVAREQKVLTDLEMQLLQKIIQYLETIGSDIPSEDELKNIQEIIVRLHTKHGIILVAEEEGIPSTDYLLHYSNESWRKLVDKTHNLADISQEELRVLSPIMSFLAGRSPKPSEYNLKQAQIFLKKLKKYSIFLE